MKINANLISASLRRMVHSLSGRSLLFAFAFNMSVNINHRWGDLRSSRIIVRVASTGCWYPRNIPREFFPMTNVHCSYHRRHCCGRNNDAIYTKMPRYGNSGSVNGMLLFVPKMQITTLVATLQHDWH